MEPARPLSYARWFARHFYRAGVLLLLAEMLVINTQHVTHLMSQIMCGSDGGAARQDLGQLMPERRRSDEILISFPCTAKYSQQLLYTLRSAVFINPFFELRVHDDSHACHIFVQLLILVAAASATGLHERLRHALLICIAMSTTLSIEHSWAPHNLKPLVSAGALSSERWQIAGAFYFWQILTILRVPFFFQIFAALAAWHGRLQAALCLVVITLLPYFLRRLWECSVVRLQYRVYLRSCDGDGGECCGTEVLCGEGGATSAAGKHLPAAPQADDTPSCAMKTAKEAESDARRELLKSNRRACNQVYHRGASLAATGGPVADSFERGGADVIYTSTKCHTFVFSLKLPHVEVGGKAHFTEVAARVTTATTSALASYNADNVEVLSNDPCQIIEGERIRRRQLKIESLACVEGCVHVLMVVSMSGGSGGGARRAFIHHQELEILDESGDIDTVGMGDAVRELIDNTTTAITGAGADDLAVDLAPASVPNVLIWPPVLPRSDEGEGGCVAVVALRCRSLSGLSAMRCVVVGPTGQGAHTVHMDEELRLWSEQADEGSSSELEGSFEGYFIVRLALPESALRTQGELYLHLLGGTSSSAADAGHEGAEELLASLPLLVLTKDAVHEVRQLYSEALSEAVMRCLDGLTSLDGNNNDISNPQAASSSSSGSGGGDGDGGGNAGAGPSRGRGPESAQLGEPEADLLATAATAILQTGLMSLIFDMGYMLRVGQHDAGGQRVAAVAGAEVVSFTGSSVQQAPDPAVVAYILNFLSSRGMRSCVQAVQGALDNVWGVMTSTRREHTALEPAGDMAVGGEGGGGQGRQATPEGQLEPLHEAEEAEGAAFNDMNVVKREVTDATTEDSGGSNNLKSAPWWWLRALLTGFSSADVEESYQSYKAEQCSKLDRMAWILNGVIRSCTVVRTCLLAAAGGATAQPLSHLQLALWLWPSLMVTAVALRRRGMSGRHRNAILMLRGYLDMAVYALIKLPTGGEGSLLPLPAAWIVPDRHLSVQWIYASFWEPATMQLSAYLQARLALVGAVHLLVLSRHYLDSWTEAAIFAVGNILVSTAVAALTDLPLRRRFLHQQQTAANPSGDGHKGREEVGSSGSLHSRVGGDRVEEH